jgi:hypothetical protein
MKNLNGNWENYKEYKVVNRKFFLVMPCIALVFSLSLSGCATNVASVKTPDWNKKPIPIYEREYTILGNVKLEKNWFGILGFSVSNLGIDSYVYQNGGVTYADLLEEAQRLYPEADAVIDVIVDFAGSTYAIFYSRRKNIVTGLAVKYVKEPGVYLHPSL